MPNFNTIVLYPSIDDLQFDQEYYLKTHMPLVEEKFGPLGLKRWEITLFQPGPDGSKPQYHIQALLVWETPEAMVAATSNPEAAGPVFGDIKNFTNSQPILLAGPVVGST